MNIGDAEDLARLSTLKNPGLSVVVTSGRELLDGLGNVSVDLILLEGDVVVEPAVGDGEVVEVNRAVTITAYQGPSSLVIPHQLWPPRVLCASKLCRINIEGPQLAIHQSTSGAWLEAILPHLIHLPRDSNGTLSLSGYAITVSSADIIFSEASPLFSSRQQLSMSTPELSYINDTSILIRRWNIPASAQQRLSPTKPFSHGLRSNGVVLMANILVGLTSERHKANHVASLRQRVQELEDGGGSLPSPRSIWLHRDYWWVWLLLGLLLLLVLLVATMTWKAGRGRWKIWRSTEEGSAIGVRVIPAGTLPCVRSVNNQRSALAGNDRSGTAAQCQSASVGNCSSQDGTSLMVGGRSTITGSTDSVEPSCTNNNTSLFAAKSEALDIRVSHSNNKQRKLEAGLDTAEFDQDVGHAASQEPIELHDLYQGREAYRACVCEADNGLSVLPVGPAVFPATALQHAVTLGPGVMMDVNQFHAVNREQATSTSAVPAASGPLKFRGSRVNSTTMSKPSVPRYACRATPSPAMKLVQVLRSHPGASCGGRPPPGGQCSIDKLPHSGATLGYQGKACMSAHALGVANDKCIPGTGRPCLQPRERVGSLASPSLLGMLERSHRANPGAWLPLLPSLVDVILYNPFNCRVLGKIGSGGCGIVYKVEHEGEIRAMKVSSHMLSSDTSTRYTQAVAEAQLGFNLSHPHVLQTLDFRLVEARRPQDGLRSGDQSESDEEEESLVETYMMMEYCDLGDLRSLVHHDNWEPSAKDMVAALRALLDVARAIAYLQEQHIIHGDLKCSNVLMTSGSSEGGREYVLKVGDFGTSRMLQRSAKTHTVLSKARGTVSHMAPELIEHRHLSRAADVYAFGVLVYEVMTKKTPYEGHSKVSVIYFATMGRVSEALVFGPHCPARVVQLAQRCWSTELEQRPKIHEVMSDLVDIIRSVEDEVG